MSEQNEQITGRIKAIHQLEVQALIAQIMSAAYRKTLEGKAHVFVNYSGHVNDIDVYALPAETDYLAGEDRERIIDAHIKLWPHTEKATNLVLIRQELTDLLDQLLEL